MMTKKSTYLIEKAIKDGHLIAEKIKNADSVSEIDDLADEIEEYCDFVDENFGVINNFDERDCSLTTSLYVALDWKKKSAFIENKDNETTNRLSAEFLKQFIEELDSRSWADNR